MVPNGFNYRRQQSEHHWALAGMAVLFSAVLHLVFIYYFGDWNFGGLTRVAQRSREWMVSNKVPSMRVETLSADPMRIVDKVPGERDTPSRGPIEVSDRVDSLSQEANPALTAPPPIPREALSPGVPALSETSASVIDTTPWMPRQEIKQIFDRTVQDEVAALPRREIPMVERIQAAPDIVPSIDLAGRKFGKELEPPKPLKAAEVFDTEIVTGTFAKPVVAPPAVPEGPSGVTTGSKFADQPGDKRVGSETGKPGIVAVTPSPGLDPSDGLPSLLPPATLEERLTRKAREQIEAIEKTADYQSIDDLLAIGLETYRDPKEPGQLYFRVAIQPRSDKVIPIIAKDILWIQDVSGSMTSERLAFCRKALLAAVATMNPQDRFDVIAFRDTFESCFSVWTPVNPENIQTAVSFISKLQSYGQTDVFGSLSAVMKRERDPMRPMIAFVVTDGKPTTGVVGSSKIIGDFTALNSGLMSVYMFGTEKDANGYLLDMLTYCNRGKSYILDGNRWDIPSAMATMYNGIRNPVMGDITVVFDNASRSEVYPSSTPNLYQDQQLEMIGVCPDGTEELVLQVRGLAAGKGYDSIFRLNIREFAKPGSPLIKLHWARQKMFYLVGEHTVRPHQQIFAEMLKVNQKFGVEIPYKVELK
ncbi:MAG: VWA domain-containing protein [Kiritimatiellae bacterium]|nr:VWA domain-containing protein [Kiritimatiellia bacterium]